ncbi:putative cytoplasmic protein [Yersinia kristensenii]|nr:putative cytoplasmic protein [Yersinia kristensenii]
MGLIDEWAERHIMDAQEKGELDNLPGNGRPLLLDDDTFVPSELRAGYRLLKNAGYLPPELQDRQEALTIAALLSQLDTRHNDYSGLHKRLVYWS